MKYKAFISYSHAADEKLAPALQKALQVLAKPWYKKQTFDVFRDQTDLSASPHLWQTIETALQSSEYLIFLASAKSSSSKWVTKELQYWLTHKSIDTLILVLTDGEIIWNDRTRDFDQEQSTAIPEVLLKQFQGEPHYIDLRFVQKNDDLSLDNQQFIDSLHPIAATLHAKTVADLFGEINLQHKKTLRIRNTVIIALSILVILAVSAALFARFKQKQAKKEQVRAESNLYAVYSTQKLETDPTKSYQMAEAAFLKDRRNPAAYSALLKAYHSPYPYYGIFAETENNIHQLSISPDRKLYLALSGEYSDTVCLSFFDLEGNEIRKLHFRENLSNIYLNPQQNLILGIENKDIRKKYYEVIFWDLDGNKVKSCCRHEDEIVSVAFSPDGKYILTASSDHNAVIWDMEGQLVKKFTHPWHVNSAEFSPDGNAILTSSKSEAFIWDLSSGKKTTLSGHNSFVEATYVSNGKRILTFGWDNTAILWDNKGAEINRIAEYDQWITSADFNSTGNYILLVSGGTVYIFQNEFQFNMLKAGKSDINSAIFTSDGKQILTSESYGNTIRIWEIKENRPLLSMEDSPIEFSYENHDHKPSQLAAYNFMAQDGNVIIQDTSGIEIIDFRLDGALNVYFSNDSRYLVVPASSSTIPLAYYLLIDPDEIIKEVNARAARLHKWGVNQK